jgi:hypothetical protein
VMDEVEVVERMMSQQVPGAMRIKVYTVRLKMFTAAEYSQEYSIQPSDVEAAIEKEFSRRLERLILKQLRRPTSNINVADDDIAEDIPAIGKPVAQGKRTVEDDSQEVVARDDGKSFLCYRHILFNPLLHHSIRCG